MSDETPTESRPARLTTVLLVAILCLAAIAHVFYGRLIAPADLYRKDQNKTMSYTVDMVLHGRWSLPRDVLYQPATKPPLYNWLAALVVGPLHVYDEWAQKWPSVAASAAIAALLLWWCRRQFASELGKTTATIVGLLAAAIWMAGKSTVLLLYIARPDMVQALCLIGAWMAGTIALERASKRAALGPAIWFWLCVTAAALAKGPAAIYAILYVILAAKLSFGAWGRARNLRWIPGLIVLFGSVGLWLLCAYRQDPEHVTGVLIGTEVVKRIAASNPEGFVKPVYYSVMWFVTQNPYWSAGAVIVTLVMLVRAIFGPRSDRTSTAVRSDENASPFDARRDPQVDPIAQRSTWWRRFFSHGAGQATLWILVVVGCLSIPKDKRMDFLLPSHPAVAVVAAYGAVAVLARTRWARYALPFAAIAFLIWMGRPFKVEAIGSAIHSWTRPALVLPAAYMLKIGGGVAAAALIAGLLWLTRRWIRLEYLILALGVLYWSDAMVQGVYKFTKLPGKNNASVYAGRFARSARDIVGTRNVVCIIRSKHPILTIMGRHQGSYLTRADFEHADYVIAETSKFPTLKPVLVTKGNVPVDYGSIGDPDRPIAEDEVGLFKIDHAAHSPTVDQMISIQKWVADWTSHDANPYRSKNTVWIDSPNDPPEWTPPPGDPWIERARIAATRPWAKNKDESDE